MTSKPHYGPDNPHPLSTMKTELVWDGKYDCHGKLREVDIAGAAMQKWSVAQDCSKKVGRRFSYPT